MSQPIARLLENHCSRASKRNRTKSSRNWSNPSLAQSTNQVTGPRAVSMFKIIAARIYVAGCWVVNLGLRGWGRGDLQRQWADWTRWSFPRWSSSWDGFGILAAMCNGYLGFPRKDCDSIKSYLTDRRSYGGMIYLEPDNHQHAFLLFIFSDDFLVNLFCKARTARRRHVEEELVG